QGEGEFAPLIGGGSVGGAFLQHAYPLYRFAPLVRNGAGSGKLGRTAIVARNKDDGLLPNDITEGLVRKDGLKRFFHGLIPEVQRNGCRLAQVLRVIDERKPGFTPDFLQDL